MNGLVQGIGKLDARQRKEAIELIKALDDYNITSLGKAYFDFNKWDVFYNPNSEYVFLSDEDYNTLMFNDDNILDLFISTPYSGHEGSFDQLIDIIDDMESEDKMYLIDIATDDLKEKHKEVLERVRRELLAEEL